MIEASTSAGHRLRERVQQLLDGGKYRGDQPLRTLRLLLRGQERRLALALVFYAIKQSPQWVMPLATRKILDSLMKPSPASAHVIAVWSIIAAVCLLQNIPMHTLYANQVSAATRDMQRDLRSALVMRLQQLSISFHGETDAGRLQTKMLRDVDNVGGLLKSSIDTLLPTVLIITISMVMALTEAPLVAVFFVVCAPVACALIWLFRKDMENVSVQINEMIEMLPVTRAHAAEERETVRMRRHLGRLTASGRRMDVITERFGASSWVTFNMFQLLCLVFCAILVGHRQLTLGQLVMFQAYFGMIIGQVNATLGLLPQLAAGGESIRSIGEVLESPDVEQDEHKQAVHAIAGELIFDRVTYSYPGADKPAIEDFSLEIAPGECVGLVGESGSGKSTILNLVIGFRRPASGRILLDGIDTADINFRSFRSHLAIVPQNTVLFSGTVRENITYGLDNISDDRLQQALERAKCDEFVSRMPQGLDTPIGPRGGKLSGGQRQRIALARALLRDPSMLILDEATSALDAQSERLVQEAIEELIRGRTTIMIAHRLATLRAADRIVVMRQGKIIEQGSWSELLSRPDSAFARTYALQNQIYQPQAA